MYGNKGYVVVTDYIDTEGGRDLSDDLQRLIDENPNRTIYFPDGVYLLSKPICTPANPIHSVSLELSTYAIIRAADDWSENEALVRLGASEPFNDINTVGSNYYLTGGIIDGNGKANGISIDSGRETCVHHVSIKNTRIGIHIKWGANNCSSDADIHNVNIVGNNAADSVGVLLEGYDNTVSNMRIASCHKGICAYSGGNIFRDLHPLYIYDGENALEENYLTSVAFESKWGNNYFDICYSDQFCTAFSVGEGLKNIIDKPFIMWYSPKGNREVAFEMKGAFNSIISNAGVNFREDTKENVLLSVGNENGSGILLNPIINDAGLISDNTYEKYIEGKLI